MPPARQGADQRNRSAIASGISKATRWKITRKNRRPRGLENGGASCYRNSVLQSLLHMPKFLNWIMQHNENGQNWPCHPTDPNRTLPDDEDKDDILEKLGTQAMGCVPCVLKSLITGYWGNIRLGPTGAPLSLPYNHACWSHLHQLSGRWFYPGWSHQQDVDEYLRQILSGIQSSYDSLNANSEPTKRKQQYDSLFTRTIRQVSTCNICNHVKPTRTVDEIGYIIIPLPMGTADSIRAAIVRDRTEKLTMKCDECETDTPHTRVSTNTAMPEYLYIRNNNYDYATGGKNRNPIAVPEVLDLTADMYRGEGKDRIKNHLPVRYGLRHIMYHSGRTLTRGHYTASVTGMPPVGGNRQIAHVKEFFCNDDRVTNLTPGAMNYPAGTNVLTENPLMHKYSEFDGSSWIYVRLPNRAPAAPQAAPVVVSQGEIAERVKSRVRKPVNYAV